MSEKIENDEIENADLSNLKLGLGEVVIISDWLKKTTKLTNLNLSGNKDLLGKIVGGTGKGLKTLVDGISKNNTLVELDLSNIRLNSKGALLIQKAIRNKWNFKKLVIHEENISLGIGGNDYEVISQDYITLINKYLAQNEQYKKVKFFLSFFLFFFFLNTKNTKKM